MASVSLFSLMGKIAIDGVEQTTKDLEDVSKSGKSVESALSTNFTNIANKAGELGKKAAIGIAGIATAAIAAVEGTREFRQDLGKLTTAFEELAMDGAAQGTKTFKELYAVLGEDDTAIEAANNLVALTGDTKELEEWTNILTGVYASFGDSLPIEGLAEAANETMRTGTLTGGLTDAINWASLAGETFGVKLKENTKANEEWNKKVAEATTAEEYFQLALEECADASEREKLIRETLNGLYGNSAEIYKETNKSVMDNNKAQAELNLKMAEMAEKLEPLVTKGKMFLVEVLDKISPALTWIIDNINILAPIVIGLIGTLLAFGLVGKIAAFINTIKTLQTAFAALNITMSLNPVGLVIAAIVALIAIFVTLWNKCEWFRNFWIGLWENIKSIVSVAIEGIKNFFMGIINFVKDNWQALLLLLVNPFAGAFKLLYDNCEGFRDFVNKWVVKIKDFFVNGFNKIIDFFKNNWKGVLLLLVNPIAGAFKLLYDNCEGFRNFVNNFITAVKNFFVNGFNTIKTKVVSTFTNTKNNIVNLANSLKSGLENKFNSIKNTVTTIFNRVKTAITSPIQTASNVVKGVIDKIKGFFNFNVSLPKIKLPHFSIQPSGWQLGDLLEGSIPRLGISWYAKGGIFDEPTIFPTAHGLKGVGEAGPEAVAPISELMKYTTAAVDGSNAGLEDKLDRVINLLTNYLPTLQNQQVVLSTGELVGALTGPLDKSLGQLAEDRRRGR